MKSRKLDNCLIYNCLEKLKPTTYFIILIRHKYCKIFFKPTYMFWNLYSCNCKSVSLLQKTQSYCLNMSGHTTELWLYTVRVRVTRARPGSSRLTPEPSSAQS